MDFLGHGRRCSVGKYFPANGSIHQSLFSWHHEYSAGYWFDHHDGPSISKGRFQKNPNCLSKQEDTLSFFADYLGCRALFDVFAGACFSSKRARVPNRTHHHWFGTLYCYGDCLE